MSSLELVVALLGLVLSAIGTVVAVLDYRKSHSQNGGGTAPTTSTTGHPGVVTNAPSVGPASHSGYHGPHPAAFAPAPKAGYQPQSGNVHYANWGTRVGACIVDALASLPFLLLALLLDEDVGPLFSFLLVIGIAVQAYNRWFLAGQTGQSWGKKALGIFLMNESNQQPIGAGMAFLRDIAHYVDGILYIGFVFPLLTRKRQTIADMIVKTVVVKKTW